MILDCLYLIINLSVSYYVVTKGINNCNNSRHCRGEDDRKLIYEYRPKSVSAEVNYGIRFRNKDESDNFVKQLCDEVEKRLDDVEMIGKTVTLKLMVLIVL